MSVHWPGENWVVIDCEDERSEKMTRSEAERHALLWNRLPDCGCPFQIAQVDEHGNIIGEPQTPKPRRH
jgi:hypothetical protein